MNPLENLMLGQNGEIASDAFDEFVKECAALGIQPLVNKRPTEAYAAFEDYVPTAIVVFLAKPFFDAFLKKAGEDAYAAFKKGLTTLVAKAASVRVLVFASAAKKVDPSNPFSRVVSVYSKSPDGTTMKFLFFAEGDEEYFRASTDSLCELLRSGDIPRPDHRAVGGIYLLYYDRDSKKWIYRQK